MSYLTKVGYLLCISAFFFSSNTFAENRLTFVPKNYSCASIVGVRDQWKPLAPDLPDPEKIALIDHTHNQSTEWKRLYLPRIQLNQHQLESDRLMSLLMEGHRVSPHNPEPGLLVNNQAWIDYLGPCPNMISSNRDMSSGSPDWVAPFFFERYQLTLGGESRPVISTRFRDQSSRFSGHYVALYLGEYCPAEKLFASQGDGQTISFLTRNNQLVMSLKQPGKRIESFLTFVEETIDNSYFIEICRGILKK